MATKGHDQPDPLAPDPADAAAVDLEPTDVDADVAAPQPTSVTSPPPTRSPTPPDTPSPVDPMRRLADIGRALANRLRLRRPPGRN